MKKLILFLMILISLKTFGQNNACQTLMLLEKGKELKMRSNMTDVNKNGFYLYRNCIYDIKLKNEQEFLGRLIDIKPDSISITTVFNENVALKTSQIFDTLTIHVKEMDKLILVADRSMGVHTSILFSNYDFVFKMDTMHCALESIFAQLYNNDPKIFEIVPHLTAQGVGYLYESDGRTYYFYGTGMTKPILPPQDMSFNKRNILWFTPNEVEEINGIALGLFAENLKNDSYNDKDSLKINGLNIEINLLALFALLHGNFSGPYADSIEFYNQQIKNKWELKINGVNLSMVGTINEGKINGLNLAGANTLVDNLNGLSISGINNFSYIMNGVSIAGIRNRATKGKGLQIALFNKCDNFTGFQIGLWNNNGRRSLPFINWNFNSTSKTKS